MEFHEIALVLLAHLIGDFYIQTDDMAKGKSTSMKWLTIHVATYMIPMFMFGWKFALINGAIHWCVDFCTSKLASFYHKRGQIHNFFAVIGTDQFIHAISLCGTFIYLGGKVTIS